MTFSRQSCREVDESATPARGHNFSNVTEASVENQGTMFAQLALAGAGKSQLETTP